MGWLIRLHPVEVSESTIIELCPLRKHTQCGERNEASLVQVISHRSCFAQQARSNSRTGLANWDGPMMEKNELSNYVKKRGPTIVAIRRPSKHLVCIIYCECVVRCDEFTPSS